MKRFKLVDNQTGKIHYYSEFWFNASFIIMWILGFIAGILIGIYFF